ncbi:hypothetical protein [Azohydromonas aeria]|uniref:hypothetical protein n=1 Tax=Azohydromonas aeria TaxID=2590212 RepID=UPI0012FC5316|nr:hypothetical protein [Azohydromonas aeria]
MNRSSPVGMMLQYAFGPGPVSAKPPSGSEFQASNDTTCEVSPQMLALAAAARTWWEAGRPKGWSLEQHLADPAAGCNASARERALAEAVAQWVKQSR